MQPPQSPSPFETPNANLDRAADVGLPGTNGRESMAYMEALKSFFAYERWGKNLGFLSLCVLIPIAGMLAMLGYLISLTAKQHQIGEHYLEGFTWDRFGDYIGRGVWPFLTMLILSLAITPVFLVFGVGVALAVDGGISEAVGGILLLFSGIFFMVLMVAMTMVMQPVLLRAAFLQKVSGVFDMAFIKDFISKMWLEIILAALFNFAVSMVGVFLGYLACGLGLYPAMAVMNWTQWQLHRQLYEVYLFRGGTPIPFAPPLVENP